MKVIQDRVVARRGAAHLKVLRDGEVVIDRTFGCPPGTSFLIFSAGKPLLAVLVHLLVERGLLTLDDPIAQHWPEFARHGKGGITVRHVLQHRAGIPVARSLFLDALAAPSWQRSIRALEAARPVSGPGERPAYHILSFGHILGEVVRRVTGADLRDVLRAALLEPLGMKDTFLGLPPDRWAGRLKVRSRGRGRAAQVFFNTRAVRRAVIPAATMTSTAADLARFYQAMLDGGGGTLPPSVIRAAVTPTCDMEIDGLLGVPVRWSQGFQLGGPCPDPTTARPMGTLSSRAAFGHNGSNACVAWADPERRLVLVYLSNLPSPEFTSSPHQSAVSDTVLRAYPLTEPVNLGRSRRPGRHDA